MRYQVLPAADNQEKQIREERELEQTHTAFSREKRIFEEIRLGNPQAVRAHFHEYLEAGFVMGAMSENSVRRMKYWAVSGIALAVHYAILGGADETDAFNLSDDCIRYVDKEHDEDRMIRYLEERLTDLTYMVYYAKMRGVSSPEIRRCLHYIYLNLHRKITIEQLAEECLISKSYLTALFRKEMGTSVMDYVRRQKITAASLLLEQGEPVWKVAYEFGFCSETHFIETYKRYKGETPGRGCGNAKA